MKIIVFGLDGANPEILFQDERLTNFRRLMEFGCYGQVQSIIPATSIPAWMCVSTSQDPGSLGVYGSLNRIDYSYKNFRIATSELIEGIAVWDQVARAGKRSIIVGVPPSYPPLKVNGIFVGYHPDPDTNNAIFTYPAPRKEEIDKIVGEGPAQKRGLPTDTKDWVKDDFYSRSRRQFKVVRHLLQGYEWDYFQFVEVGLDRLQHAFWQFRDPRQVLYEQDDPYESVIRDYYFYLDDELGKIFDLLDDFTAILIVSCYVGQRLDSGTFLNEWLVKEGLLVLNEYPKEVTPFDKLSVNWEKTRVWSKGGQYAQIFFNVKGRESKGTIDKTGYEEFRDEMKGKLEATVDEKGNTLETLVFKPEEIYRTVHNIAPDLIVHFGRSPLHSIGSLDHGTIPIQEKINIPERCNHRPIGSFILASTDNSLHGEVKGAHLLDMAPTLLELGGYDIPDSMQGKSLIRDKSVTVTTMTEPSVDEEEAIRQRLKGLGYIS